MAVQVTIGTLVGTWGSGGKIFDNTITLDSSYTSGVGGLALTPASLGYTTAVYYGNPQITTSASGVSSTGGNGGFGTAVLNCSTPTAPKLTIFAPNGTELGTGLGAGMVISMQTEGV